MFWNKKITKENDTLYKELYTVVDFYGGVALRHRLHHISYKLSAYRPSDTLVKVLDGRTEIYEIE